MKLTIDQQTAILREALESGASIDINFYDIKSREEGMKVINHYSKLVGESVIERKTVSAFSLDHYGPIKCTVFFELSVQEKKQKLLDELNRMNAENIEGGKDLDQAN